MREKQTWKAMLGLQCEISSIVQNIEANSYKQTACMEETTKDASPFLKNIYKCLRTESDERNLR